VVCVEKNPVFPADYRDVFTYEPVERFDIILASPVCTGFSVMHIGKNWTRDHQPKTDSARLSLSMVERSRWIISRGLKPGGFFIIENPRAKLRKLPVVADLERRTVTYCHYGEKRMKPTDLFGVFPPSLILEAPCKNGMPCHISAPRGSTTGTQGMASADSAKVPYALSLAVCLAAERDMLLLGGLV